MKTELIKNQFVFFCLNKPCIFLEIKHFVNIRIYSVIKIISNNIYLLKVNSYYGKNRVYLFIYFQMICLCIKSVQFHKSSEATPTLLPWWTKYFTITVGFQADLCFVRGNYCRPRKWGEKSLLMAFPSLNRLMKIDRLKRINLSLILYK